jgi:hypothetical protein
VVDFEPSRSLRRASARALKTSERYGFVSGRFKFRKDSSTQRAFMSLSKNSGTPKIRSYSAR